MIEAIMLKTNAYHKGEVAPNTTPIATPPKETCAKPSPINARFRISKNVPNNPATIVTIIAEIIAL